MEGRAVGSPYVNIQFDFDGDKHSVPIATFDYAYTNQDGAQVARNSKFILAAATRCGSKSPNVCAVSFVCWHVERPGLSSSDPEVRQ